MVNDHIWEIQLTEKYVSNYIVCLPLDSVLAYELFCDGGAVVVGIMYSRSWDGEDFIVTPKMFFGLL